MKHLVLLFALCGLAACAHRPPPAQYAPRTTPRYRTYPISAAFAKNGPVLRRAQRAWIRRVLASKNYGRLRARLRFADLPGGVTPIVVYVAPAADPGANLHVSAHILGESCNAYFDPYEMGVFAAPGDAACAAPTPKPVE